MSYADYLRTRQINQPKIFDRRMALGDASNHIQRKKLGAAWIQGSTNHVINNQFDPFIPNPSTSKKPTKFVGSGAGGRVQDASLYTMTLGARSVAEDKNRFSSVKTVQAFCNRATPAPSLVINSHGNIDGNSAGLNMGYADTCSLFQPLTPTHSVVRNPALGRLGVQSSEAWNGALGTQYGGQNKLSTSCTTTMVGAVDKQHITKLIHHGNLNSRPVKADFRTSVMGLQVSADGKFGRPGKVGGLVERPKYIESHHGNPNIDHPSKLSLAEVRYNKPPTHRIPKNA